MNDEKQYICPKMATKEDFDLFFQLVCSLNPDKSEDEIAEVLIRGSEA